MWLNPQDAADSVTFTEEILDGKSHFLCSAFSTLQTWENKNAIYHKYLMTV